MTFVTQTDTATRTPAPRDRSSATSAEDVLARFRPLIARIAEGAVQRELDRALPYAEVEWLRDAGFGALRVPREHGGDGVGLHTLFALLIELASADSNLPQLLRGHLGFVETQLGLDDSPTRTEWFRRIASDRILFGNAQAERGPDTQTVVEERDGRWVIDGTKYYSTGTLFADWIWSSAKRGDEPVALAVRADAPGVTRVDDWDAFGQRLTGSGTTTFDAVEVDPRHIVSFIDGEPRPHSYVTAFYQLVLLAALSGIADAAVRETAAFVRPRRRTFGIPGESSPRHDPLVQRVVGRVSALAFSARSNTLAAVDALAPADTAAGDVQDGPDRYGDALIQVFQAQQVVIGQALEATSLLFEVGGASATSDRIQLDRLWRNARTIASHNPAIHREQALGDFVLNDVLPLGWHERVNRNSDPTTRKSN
jgi:alkylation response protein AidB-like acyl-CoA dehydrogenase